MVNILSCLYLFILFIYNFFGISLSKWILLYINILCMFFLHCYWFCINVKYAVTRVVESIYINIRWIFRICRCFFLSRYKFTSLMSSTTCYTIYEILIVDFVHFHREYWPILSVSIDFNDYMKQIGCEWT